MSWLTQTNLGGKWPSFALILTQLCRKMGSSSLELHQIACDPEGYANTVLVHGL